MLRDFTKLWAIFGPIERRQAKWRLAMMVLMAAADTAGVVSILPFLSVLSRPGIIHESLPLQRAYGYLGFTSERSFILALGILSIVVVVAGSIFKAVTQHQLNRFVHLQRHHLSTRLLSTYLHQPYEYFLTCNTADLNKNILSEVDQLIANLVQPLFQVIAQGIVVFAMAVLIISYDPLMALSTLAAISLLYGAIYILVRKHLGRIGAERVTANRTRFKSCREALDGIKEIKISDSANVYLNRYIAASRLHARDLAANETLSQTPLYFVEAVGYTGLIIIALVLLARSDDLSHVLPALGLYGFAAYRMLPAVQIMYRGFAKLRFSTKGLDLIFRELSQSPTITHKNTQLIQPLQHAITLNNVTYAYPSKPDTPVIDQLSISIPAHHTTAISGPSGAGKSTLMDILLGLLEPQSGTLAADDVTITGHNVRAWQNTIGYVPQHIYLLDASVRDNIAFGVAPEQINDHMVMEAAKAAQIHTYITNELPDGYNTSIGERGIRLSGGQRQRIGIARALYRDPPILLLDEATSALDSQTEKAVNDALKCLSGKKTIIIITHKEHLLPSCDHRITLE